MIWFDDPIEFLKNRDNWFKIIPEKDMSHDDQINAIVMFSIYFALLILLIKQDFRGLYVLLFVLILTYFLKQHLNREAFQNKKDLDKINVVKHKMHNDYCTKPTENNPFMNVNMNDYTKFPNRPKACIISDVQDDVDKYFDKNLPRNQGDIYHKNASDRQYYSMPSTSIPNNLDDFKSFVYNINPTLKQRGQNY